MYINGKVNMFDSEQARSTGYTELFRLPTKLGTTVSEYSHILRTDADINILNFLHNGTGELRLTVGSPFMASDGVFVWHISWDSTGCDGDIVIYGNK